MANQIQAGTMLIQPSALLQSLGMAGEPYCKNWSSLGTVDSSTLDATVRTARWNLFFMAEELRAIVPAWGGQKTLQRGVRRILAKVGAQDFNCLQVSHVLKRHFLGVPYLSIAGHARHIQESCNLQSSAQRASENASELAKANA